MSYLYLVFLIAGVGVIQYLVGGTRLLFSLPAYEILAIGSFLTLISIRRVKNPPRLNCLISTAVLFSYILVRCLHSPIDYLARPDFFMVLGCLLVYLITGFYINESRPRLLFIYFLLAFALLNVGVGVFQFMGHNDFMLQGFLKAHVDPRASGLFISPNHFAGFLEAVAIMGLSLVWWGRMKLWVKLVIGYVALGCYFGVAISGSRGGYFTSLASLFVFVGLSLNVVRIADREKFVRMGLIILALLSIAVTSAVYLMFHNATLQARMKIMVAKDVRIYNWQASLDQFQTAPVFGTGAGTHLYYGRLFRRPQIQADPVHSHGDYLELLCEYGLIGAAGLLIFLWFHVRNGLRAYSWLVHKRLMNSYIPRSDTLAINVGALSAIAGLAVHSVVDFNMHIPGNALVFAFIFALVASPGLESSDSGWTLKIAGLFRFALPLLAIWVVVAGIPKLPAEYFSELSRIALRNKSYVLSIQNANVALGAVAPDAVWPESAIRILRGEKKNPDLYFYIGESNRVMGLNFKNPVLRNNYLNLAVEAYRQGLGIFPQDEHTLVRMAQALDGLKRYDDAEEAFGKAMALDPNLGVIYGYYGAHLKAMGKDEESKDAYDKGQKLTNESIQQLGQAELGF
ncbi:MAG: O-antigen ligase family protein [Verrucomicrobiota bacterium]